MAWKILWLHWFWRIMISVNKTKPFPDVIKKKKSKKEELLLAARIFSRNILLYLHLLLLTCGPTNLQQSGVLQLPTVFIALEPNVSVFCQCVFLWLASRWFPHSLRWMTSGQSRRPELNLESSLYQDKIGHRIAVMWKSQPKTCLTIPEYCMFQPRLW